MVDKLSYESLLVPCGFKTGSSRGQAVYSIKEYHDLNPLLGEGWHARVLNKCELQLVEYLVCTRVRIFPIQYKVYHRDIDIMYFETNYILSYYDTYSRSAFFFIMYVLPVSLQVEMLATAP